MGQEIQDPEYPNDARHLRRFPIFKPFNCSLTDTRLFREFCLRQLIVDATLSHPLANFRKHNVI